MKKTILKTAFATLGVVIMLAIAAFGIASFCAPAAMMNFTARLGMEGISGDYAYQEYERSGDLNCLARAFIIAAEKKDNRAANERFLALYGEEGSERREEFDNFCLSYELAPIEGSANALPFSFREYLCGLESCVMYRLAKSPSGKNAARVFAISETNYVTSSSPVVSLILEAFGENDEDCAALLLYQASSYKNDNTFNNLENIYRNLFKRDYADYLQRTYKKDGEGNFYPQCVEDYLKEIADE